MQLLVFLILLAVILWILPWIERGMDQRQTQQERQERAVQYYQFTDEGSCPHCGANLAAYLIETADRMTAAQFPQSQIPALECPACHRRLHPQTPPDITMPPYTC